MTGQAQQGPAECGAEPDGQIEPTTGAPLASLPRRAAVVRTTTRRPDDAGGGPAGPAPGAIPSAREAPRTDESDDFWLPIEEVNWDGSPLHHHRPRESQPLWRLIHHRLTRFGDRTPPLPPRHPLAAMAGLLAFALLATFFSWVAAEPLWLASGRGTTGVATVTECVGRGLAQRCRGEFLADTGEFTLTDVRLSGVTAEYREPGSLFIASMIGPDGRTAYAEDGGATGHLRWLLSLALVVACGVGIGWATGALRLADRRSRRLAALASLAGPLLLTFGFVLVAA